MQNVISCIYVCFKMIICNHKVQALQEYINIVMNYMKREIKKKCPKMNLY